jgi:hypothetical protein
MAEARATFDSILDPFAGSAEQRQSVSPQRSTLRKPVARPTPRARIPLSGPRHVAIIMDGNHRWAKATPAPWRGRAPRRRA